MLRFRMQFNPKTPKPHKPEIQIENLVNLVNIIINCQIFGVVAAFLVFQF